MSRVFSLKVDPEKPYSDAGEDRWILKQFPDGYVGKAVELGALDGRYLSNTLLLEERGWDCLCIEPNPRHYAALTKNRKRVLRCACASEPAVSQGLTEDRTAIGFTKSSLGAGPVTVTVLTLDQCLILSGFQTLDVLSLDTDGSDMDILAGFTVLAWSPKAMILETNGKTGPVHEWALANGYRCAARIGNDGCYLREGS